MPGVWAPGASLPGCPADSRLCYDCRMPSLVRKAVFPAAGLGTRFLPATKAQPKEMLPLVDKPMVGQEPFAVVLGDDVIDADPPALKQLIDVFERVGGPVLAVERVPREDTSSYGIIAPAPDSEFGDGIYQVLDLVEKPPIAEAPSDLAIIGRYVLTPDLFPILAATKSDRTGEIQLTNGLRELLKTRPIFACEIKGVRHDTGNKLGFLKAVVYFALRRPDLADKFSAYLATIGIQVPAGKR
jgi:UTP--glucose-1-phosphate uridylyltransferase